MREVRDVLHVVVGLAGGAARLLLWLARVYALQNAKAAARGDKEWSTALAVAPHYERAIGIEGELTLTAPEVAQRNLESLYRACPRNVVNDCTRVARFLLFA